MNMPGEFLAVACSLGGGAVAALATWAACRHWYGRKLVAAAQRLYKSDQGRLLSQQQAQQARKQIEQMRGEIELLRRKPGERSAQQERARALEVALTAASAHDDDEADPAPAAHGFADTQILP